MSFWNRSSLPDYSESSMICISRIPVTERAKNRTIQQNFGAVAGMPKLAFALLAVLTFASILPAVHADNCTLQITSVNYPAKTDPGQSFQVKTQVTVTCQTSAYLAGRTDLEDTENILSTGFLDIGQFTSSGGTKTVTASNSAIAPSASGSWNLVVKVTIYDPRSGGPLQQVIVAAASWPFTIQVGQTTQTETTSILVQTTTSATTITSESTTLASASISPSPSQVTMTETVTETQAMVITTERFYATLTIALAMGILLGILVPILMQRWRRTPACPNCRYKYPRDSVYCPSCGQKIS